jgi:tetratricopeptide (TPR) repeat protein
MWPVAMTDDTVNKQRRRLFTRLPSLGILLLLLLAGPGCRNYRSSKAYERGVDAIRRQDYDLAIAEFSEVIQLKPKYAGAYNNRGVSYAHTGDGDKSVADFNEAIRLNPEYVEAYYNRGIAHNLKGDWDRAIADYTEAIRLNPEYVEACINLAWLLAVCPNPDLRNGKQAVAYATKACERSEWRTPSYLGTLAAACAEKGDFDNAVKWQTKYLDSTLSNDASKKARQQLSLYEQKKPYHEDKP